MLETQFSKLKQQQKLVQHLSVALTSYGYGGAIGVEDEIYAALNQQTGNWSNKQ